MPLNAGYFGRYRCTDARGYKFCIGETLFLQQHLTGSQLVVVHLLIWSPLLRMPVSVLHSFGSFLYSIVEPWTVGVRLQSWSSQIIVRADGSYVVVKHLSDCLLQSCLTYPMQLLMEILVIVSDWRVTFQSLYTFASAYYKQRER